MITYYYKEKHKVNHFKTQITWTTLSVYQSEVKILKIFLVTTNVSYLITLFSKPRG